MPQPVPGPGQVLVRVKAAGINPGEAKIREGLLHARWPAVFPSGEGTDLAGIVAGTGSAGTGSAGTGSAGTGSAGTGSAGTGSAGTGSAGTGFSAGDEVIGYTDDRASHAEYVV